MAQAKSAARKPRRKEKKNIALGQAHIKSTFNNTIVSITDPSGAVISWASSGGVGFKGSRKSTPYAAGMAAAVADALVGADLDLAADVGGDIAAKVTLHLVVAFDVVAERDELVVAEVLDADVLVDLRRLEDLVRAGTAHAVDVREGDHHALVARDVNAGKTCHAVLLRVLWRCGAGSVPGPPARGVPPCGVLVLLVVYSVVVFRMPLAQHPE